MCICRTRILRQLFVDFGMKCPKCFKSFIVPIRYGMPGPEMQQDYYEGKIKLGGCTMDVNYPNYHCNDCKYEWQKGKCNDGHYAEI